MNLRPYQQKSKDEVLRAWREFLRVLLVLPTGTGKTVVFSHIIDEIIQDGGSVLVLAHRDELLRQAQDKMEIACGVFSTIEKANERGRLDMFSRCVVASVQSLRGKRLKTWAPDAFTHIIIDECHHALSVSYQNVLQHFSGAKVLGVTATADRGDKKNLGQYFETKAFEYELTEAIKDGYLSQITAETIPIKIDLTSVGSRAGDYSVDDLGNAIDPYLESIAKEIPKDRKTLVFLPLIATSKKMRDFLRYNGHEAQHIDGVTEDRKAVLKWYSEPGPKVLCNSMLLTEGFDQPDIDCVVCLRPTKVRALYAQIIGRGTRPAPGKKNLLILDFLYHTAKHDLIKPANLICKTPETRAIMTETLDSKGGQMDLLELESTAHIEREKALAEKLRAQANKKKRSVNPLEFALSIHSEDLEEFEPVFAWQKRPASDKQLDTLERFGFNRDDIPNKGYASALLDKLFSRAKKDLARPKQIKVLEGLGVKNAQDLKFKTASALIDKAASNGWRLGKEDKGSDNG